MTRIPATKPRVFIRSRRVCAGRVAGFMLLRSCPLAALFALWGLLFPCQDAARQAHAAADSEIQDGDKSRAGTGTAPGRGAGSWDGSCRALSTQVRGQDWGVDEWSAVRLGRVSVVHHQRGDELQVHGLSLVPRRAFAGRVNSVSPACPGECFLVASFDSGNANRLGGYFSAFSGSPSNAWATLRQWDDGRRALTLDFIRPAAGFCGVWIHLFDFKKSPHDRVYLDATPFSALTFWVRGQHGTERVLLKVSDARWERKEDSLPAGELAAFLPGGRIERSWQQVVVPFAAFPRGINRRELAGLVLEAMGPGEGRIAVKDLALCRSLTPRLPLSPPVAASIGPQRHEKALWVWNTGQVMESESEQETLLAFAKREGFTDLFLQLPNQTKHLERYGEITLASREWEPFLAKLNQNGLRAYALDGFKDYALPVWHDRVLKTVDNVIRYNQLADDGERFHGIHYDIEPYLIAGFSGPRRQGILHSYLELLEKIARRARGADLAFGVDIPFWYDDRDELTGIPFTVDFKGSRKPASEHVLDLAGHIAVMDYRTVAYGADGIIALAQTELEYAARTGKRVFVGLETTELPDEHLMEFEGPPQPGFPDKAPAGRSIVILPGSEACWVWLVEQGDWEWLRRELRRRNADLQKLAWWTVRSVTPVPAHKLTFARLGAERLQQTIAEAQREMPRYPSFAGFAIHDYLGYRKLLELRPPPPR